MKQHFLLLFAICQLLWLPVASQDKQAYLQEPVEIGNTSITIAPPAHFVKSETFPGFLHPGTAASILVKHSVGVPFVHYTGTEAKDNFEKQGLTVVSEEELKTNSGKKAFLYVLSFTVEENEKEMVFERMIFLTGDYNNTVMLNANYPQIVRELLYEVLKESLLTVQF